MTEEGRNDLRSDGPSIRFSRQVEVPSQIRLNQLIDEVALARNKAREDRAELFPTAPSPQRRIDDHIGPHVDLGRLDGWVQGLVETGLVRESGEKALANSREQLDDCLLYTSDAADDLLCV